MKLPEEYATWAIVDGWANQSLCRLAKVAGRLRLECPGKTSRIRTGLVAPGGPFRLAFRIRSSDIPKGKAIWGSVAEAGNPALARDFDLSPGGEWQDAQADFAVMGHLAWVGFDFGAASGAVEFEWIRLSDARTAIREWRFA